MKMIYTVKFKINHLQYFSQHLVISFDAICYMFYIYNEFFPPVIIISDVQPEREYLKFGNCHI